jgi:predicted nucleic acid-binding Zn ribbon protein
MKTPRCNDCGTPVHQSASYCHGCFSADPLARRRRRERKGAFMVLIAVLVSVVLLAIAAWLLMKFPVVGGVFAPH